MGVQAFGDRLPVVSLPHGGGPWPWVNVGMSAAERDALAGYLGRVADGLRPRALLVVTAHWEARCPTVSSAERPSMLYDYSGFPPESYRIQWPAPGDPALAEEVRALLAAAGFTTAADPVRGFDHGTFVPMKLAFPDATLPTVQLSLIAGLDPAQHLAMGRALAPLRDAGVLIVGSGMSYHNLRGFFGPSGRSASEAFDAWLAETVTAAPAQRAERLRRWTEAPAAREVHPREEHLLPLHVVVGAAGDDPGWVDWHGDVFGRVVSAHRFGAATASRAS
jgi:aromatic ring-opening dioxygenase catalytic subunit (LigB family)